MKIDDVILVGALILLASSVGCIIYGLEELSAQPEPEIEEPQLSIPYIIDEDGRFRIVSTVSIHLTVTTNIDESENEDTD